ncbi:MAG TPA: hypothetical protein HA362_06915 [Nanoarchaeota archaeon]|nr:hypothetical protein [Nanoarchaeota archaeon]
MSAGPDVLCYRCTNESPGAIAMGLCVKKGDRILSVLGSGDQAFALLEYADYVKAVEVGMLQAQYALERKEALKRGDAETFLRFIRAMKRRPAGSYFNPHEDYFNDERIAKLMKKAGQIDIVQADIFRDEMGIDGFNKVYLSNAATYPGNKPEDVNAFLERLALALAEPGLVYMSQRPDTIIIPSRFSLDEQLTETARKQEYGWFPCVYRKA